MYTVSSWRSHLGFVAVDLLHGEPARTVGNPSTAYVPDEVTQVSRMTMYTLSSWGCHLSIVAVNLLHQESATTVGDPCTAHVP